MRGVTESTILRPCILTFKLLALVAILVSQIFLFGKILENHRIRRELPLKYQHQPIEKIDPAGVSR